MTGEREALRVALEAWDREAASCRRLQAEDGAMSEWRWRADAIETIVRDIRALLDGGDRAALSEAAPPSGLDYGESRETLTTDEVAGRLDLPERVVIGANGAYWRDYGTHYSMCPVSDDNDPVEVIAVYKRFDASDTAWDRGFASGLRAAPPSGLDVERLVQMAEMAAGEVMTGHDWDRYHKAIGEHFRARLVRARDYMTAGSVREADVGSQLADPAALSSSEPTETGS